MDARRAGGDEENQQAHNKGSHLLLQLQEDQVNSVVNDQIIWHCGLKLVNSPRIWDINMRQRLPLDSYRTNFLPNIWLIIFISYAKFEKNKTHIYGFVFSKYLSNIKQPEGSVVQFEYPAGPLN